MNPEDVIKFEKMMANARDTWGANYQALLRVARALKKYDDAVFADSEHRLTCPQCYKTIFDFDAMPCDEGSELEMVGVSIARQGYRKALKEVEHLLK